MVLMSHLNVPSPIYGRINNDTASYTQLVGIIYGGQSKYVPTHTPYLSRNFLTKEGFLDRARRMNPLPSRMEPRHTGWGQKEEAGAPCKSSQSSSNLPVFPLILHYKQMHTCQSKCIQRQSQGKYHSIGN